MNRFDIINQIGDKYRIIEDESECGFSDDLPF